jgi:heat shock protein HtpX
VKNNHLLPLTTQQSCPQCGNILPVDAGYRSWCDRCDWNLDIPSQSEKLSLPGRIQKLLSLKISHRLHEKWLDTPPGQTRLTLTRGLVYLVSTLVHLATLSIVGLGFWLCFFALPSARLLAILLGMAILVLVSLLYLAQDHSVKPASIRKEEIPELYRTANRITSLLSTRPVAEIQFDAHFNANFMTNIWQRRQILLLGLPLLAILEGQELAALLSHELAHEVAGDTSRSPFVVSARDTLQLWFTFFYDRSRWQPRRAPTGLILLLFNVISLPAAGLLWLVISLMDSLLWIEKQRAQYLADQLAARVSGSEAQLALLDKGLLEKSFNRTLVFAFLGQRLGMLLDDFKSRVENLPARELARLRREEELTWTPAPNSGPPVFYRRDVLSKHPFPNAQLVLSATESERIHFELRPLINTMEQWAAGLDEKSFQEFFNIRW